MNRAEEVDAPPEAEVEAPPRAKAAHLKAKDGAALASCPLPEGGAALASCPLPFREEL